MHYTQLFFGKDRPTDLRLEDLVSFFATPTEESDKLEFKSYPPLAPKGDRHGDRERGVLKTICAFLNTDGGLLIWGAPMMEKESDTNSVKTGHALTPVPERYEKDAFIAKIANRITPSPKNVLFHRISTGDRYLYIFDVAASEHAPHQFEHVYYMRLDGQTLPAPHAYIDALFKKIRYPVIEGFLFLNSVHPDGLGRRTLECMLCFQNRTPLVNDEDLYCRIHTSKGLLSGRQGEQAAVAITLPNIAAVLSYGNVIDAFFSIAFDREDLQREDETFLISLWFGGRRSPMRTSQYKITMGATRPSNLNDTLKVVMENVYLYEYPEKSGPEETADFLRRMGRT